MVGRIWNQTTLDVTFLVLCEVVRDRKKYGVRSRWCTQYEINMHCSVKPELEEFLGCHTQNRMANCQSSEENTKVTGSVVDSSGYHILSKLGSDLGPGKCTN